MFIGKPCQKEFSCLHLNAVWYCKYCNCCSAFRNTIQLHIPLIPFECYLFVRLLFSYADVKLKPSLVIGDGTFWSEFLVKGKHKWLHIHNNSLFWKWHEVSELFGKVSKSTLPGSKLEVFLIHGYFIKDRRSWSWGNMQIANVLTFPADRPNSFEMWDMSTYISRPALYEIHLHFLRNSWKILSMQMYCISVEFRCDIDKSSKKIIRLFYGNRFDECVNGSRNMCKPDRHWNIGLLYTFRASRICILFSVNLANPLCHHLL